MNASDVMRTSFTSVTPTAPLLEAAQLLLKTNQRALPVMDDGGELLGIISEGDFLHRNELGISPPAGNWLESLLGVEENSPARTRMNALRVEEVMTKDPLCVDEEASLDEVVAHMDTRHVSQLPVVCGGIVVGMISRVELLTAVERALRESVAPAPATS
jgi:CBS domain-containing protein